MTRILKTMAFFYVALIFFYSSPAKAQKVYVFENNCTNPVRLAIRYQDTNNQWRSIGWWNVSPGHKITLNYQNYPLRSNNNIWYYFAETTDGSGHQWKGNRNINVNGRNVGMLEQRFQGGQEFRFGVRCGTPPLQPIEYEELTELQNHRRAKTYVRLSRNGRLEAKTNVWTAAHYTGFHGGGVVYFRDGNGNTIGFAETPQIGVDGLYVPGLESDRTVIWTHSIGQETAMKTRSIHIEHSVNPRNQFYARVQDLVKIINQLCPNKKKYEETATGGKSFTCE